MVGCGQSSHTRSWKVEYREKKNGVIPNCSSHLLLRKAFADLLLLLLRLHMLSERLRKKWILNEFHIPANGREESRGGAGRE